MVPELRGLPRRAIVDRGQPWPGVRNDDGTALIARLGIQAAFRSLIRDLEPPPYMRVDSTVVHGAPARALLELADESAADLIAIEAPSREGGGSEVAALMRDARYSVLVAPPQRG